MQQWLAMVTWQRLPVLARPRRHAELQATALTPLRRAKACSGFCQPGVEFCHVWSCALHLTLAAHNRETTNRSPRQSSTKQAVSSLSDRLSRMSRTPDFVGRKLSWLSNRLTIQRPVPNRTPDARTNEAPVQKFRS